MLSRNVAVACDDFVHGFASAQLLKNEIHRNSRTLQTRLSQHHVATNSNQRWKLHIEFALQSVPECRPTNRATSTDSNRRRRYLPGSESRAATRTKSQNHANWEPVADDLLSPCRGVYLSDKRTGRAGTAPTGEELAYPAGPKRVRCARFFKSAQAARARLQRARNSPLLPGRSESVVRGSSKGRSHPIRPESPVAHTPGIRKSDSPGNANHKPFKFIFPLLASTSKIDHLGATQTNEIVEAERQHAHRKIRPQTKLQIFRDQTEPP